MILHAMFAFDPAKAAPDPIGETLLRHFPMVTSYLDSFDAEGPYRFAVGGAIARWFSEDPLGFDRMMPERMEKLYADPMARRDFGDPPSNVGSVMQVSFFEDLWRLPNAEITIPQVASLDYLESEKDNLQTYIGRETYEAVMLKIRSASGT